MHLVSYFLIPIFNPRFLDHRFSTYGLSLLSSENLEGEDKNDDPMARVFPKVTKCLFHTYGPSGTPQRHDALCVLPLNIINEKIYIFLWFWFILVASITGIFLMYRFAVLFGAGIRTAMIQVCSWSILRNQEIWDLRSLFSRPSPFDRVKRVIGECSRVKILNISTLQYQALVVRLSKIFFKCFLQVYF